MTITSVLVGAALSALIVLTLRAAPRRAVAQTGYLAFVIMLSIYFGAHLVSSADPRIAAEAVFVAAAIAFARIGMKRDPRLIGALTLAHPLYDLLFGPQTGVADWYPGLCLGFDVVLGFGLVWLLRPAKREAA